LAPVTFGANRAQMAEALIFLVKNQDASKTVTVAFEIIGEVA
jgi:hypothetical protein